MRRFVRFAGLATLALLAPTGCGDDGGPGAPTARVVVLPEHPTVSLRNTIQLTATPFDAAGNPLPGGAVQWRVADESIASVTVSGVVTGEGVGSTTVSATSGGQQGSVVLQVTPRLGSITVEPSVVKLAPGRQGRLRPTLLDDFGQVFTGLGITWSTDSAAIATVDASGVVTAGAPGTTTVTAAAEGQSATASVSVDPVFQVASLEITPAFATVAVGDSVQLGLIARNLRGETVDGRLVEWASAAPSLATVSADGVVRGQSPGEAIVTATADGLSAEAHVTVLPPLISARAPRSR